MASEPLFHPIYLIPLGITLLTIIVTRVMDERACRRTERPVGGGTVTDVDD